MKMKTRLVLSLGLFTPTPEFGVLLGGYNLLCGFVGPRHGLKDLAMARCFMRICQVFDACPACIWPPTLVVSVLQGDSDWALSSSKMKALLSVRAITIVPFSAVSPPSNRELPLHAVGSHRPTLPRPACLFLMKSHRSSPRQQTEASPAISAAPSPVARLPHSTPPQFLWAAFSKRGRQCLGLALYACTSPLPISQRQRFPNHHHWPARTALVPASQHSSSRSLLFWIDSVPSAALSLPARIVTSLVFGLYHVLPVKKWLSHRCLYPGRFANISLYSLWEAEVVGLGSCSILCEAGNHCR